MAPDRDTGDRDTVLRRIAETHGTPFFAYSVPDVRARVRALREAFGRLVSISYAVKSNPAPGLLRSMVPEVDVLDVSSGGELEAALACGAKRVGFTGPGKREAELRAAVLADEDVVVVLESVDEAELLASLAREAGTTQRVLVRIAPTRVPPGFGDSMAGKPVAFGIDEEDLAPALSAIEQMEGLALVGYHAYSGTQCLRPAAIVENWGIFAELFRRAAGIVGRAPKELVFGSGLGIPYHEDQKPLDLAEIAPGAIPLFEGLKSEYPSVELALETGRYLVGEAGVLVTRVLRTKDSRGTRIGICDAGMNCHLAAAGMFGMAIRRNYRMKNLSCEGAPQGAYQLSGPLCTSLDVLARGVPLSRLEKGDLVVIETSGAYGPSASPTRFISHDAPAEWLVDGDRLVDARL